MSKYLRIIDTWEGQGELDEDKLLLSGVVGIISRLNDISGGLHLDTNFKTQWEQSKNFCRIPYMVFNPWVSGKVNYDWLLSNCPDSPVVAVDIEVTYPGMSPIVYLGLVNEFLSYANKNWIIKIYTGGGYLGLLPSWPKNYDYWWARYPNVMYPPTVENWTWEKFDSVADTLIWSNWLNFPQVGPIKLWQCTGDRLILPGTTKVLDVSLWPGTLDELKTWFGVKNIPLTLEERVGYLELEVAKLKSILGV